MMLNLILTATGTLLPIAAIIHVRLTGWHRQSYGRRKIIRAVWQDAGLTAVGFVCSIVLSTRQSAGAMLTWIAVLAAALVCNVLYFDIFGAMQEAVIPRFKYWDNDPTNK